MCTTIGVHLSHHIPLSQSARGITRAPVTQCTRAAAYTPRVQERFDRLHELMCNTPFLEAAAPLLVCTPCWAHMRASPVPPVVHACTHSLGAARCAPLSIWNALVRLAQTTLAHERVRRCYSACVPFGPLHHSLYSTLPVCWYTAVSGSARGVRHCTATAWPRCTPLTVRGSARQSIPQPYTPTPGAAAGADSVERIAVLRTGCAATERCECSGIGRWSTHSTIAGRLRD